MGRGFFEKKIGFKKIKNKYKRHTGSVQVIKSPRKLVFFGKMKKFCEKKKLITHFYEGTLRGQLIV